MLKQLERPEEDYPSVIKSDEAGNIIVVGYFRATVNFNTDQSNRDELSSNGSMDGFILKLDANGNYNWVESFGASDMDATTGIAIINETEMLISGFFTNEVDMDPFFKRIEYSLYKQPNSRICCNDQHSVQMQQLKQYRLVILTHGLLTVLLLKNLQTLKS